MTKHEEPLHGGAISGPVRDGATIRNERRVCMGEAAIVGLARPGAPDSMRANASWVAQWTP